MLPATNDPRSMPGPMLPVRLSCSGESQAGARVGPNQDHVAIVQDANTERGTLLIVADGLGGYARGEEASRMVCEELPELYYGRLAHESCRKSLCGAVTAINTRLYDSSQGAGPGPRMCTTIAAAAIQGRTAEIIHVGDSKAFLFRAGRVLYQSEDQCVQPAAFQAEPGHSRSPRYLTQAVGARVAVQPAQVSVPLEEGDVLLLCSDGLSDVLSPGEMLALVEGEEPAAAEQLVRRAKEKGARDDVSCILARVASAGQRTEKTPATLP